MDSFFSDIESDLLTVEVTGLKTFKLQLTKNFTLGLLKQLI